HDVVAGGVAGGLDNAVVAAAGGDALEQAFGARLAVVAVGAGAEVGEGLLVIPGAQDQVVAGVTAEAREGGTGEAFGGLHEPVDPVLPRNKLALSRLGYFQQFLKQEHECLLL